jgi:hypothetical protein
VKQAGVFVGCFFRPGRWNSSPRGSRTRRRRGSRRRRWGAGGARVLRSRWWTSQDAHARIPRHAPVVWRHARRRPRRLGVPSWLGRCGEGLLGLFWQAAGFGHARQPGWQQLRSFAWASRVTTRPQGFACATRARRSQCVRERKRGRDTRCCLGLGKKENRHTGVKKSFDSL